MREMTNEEMRNVEGGGTGDKFVSLAWCGFGVAITAAASGGWLTGVAAASCYSWFIAEVAVEAAGSIYLDKFIKNKLLYNIILIGFLSITIGFLIKYIDIIDNILFGMLVVIIVLIPRIFKYE